MRVVLVLDAPCRASHKVRVPQTKAFSFAHALHAISCEMIDTSEPCNLVIFLINVGARMNMSFIL